MSDGSDTNLMYLYPSSDNYVIESEIPNDIEYDNTQLCLTCLSPYPTDWIKNETANAYRNITGIELTNDLPNQICKSCFELLKITNEFKNKCIESYEWLVKDGNQSMENKHLIIPKKTESNINSDDEFVLIEVKENDDEVKRKTYFGNDDFDIQSEVKIEDTLPDGSIYDELYGYDQEFSDEKTFPQTYNIIGEDRKYDGTVIHYLKDLSNLNNMPNKKQITIRKIERYIPNNVGHNVVIKKENVKVRRLIQQTAQEDKKEVTCEWCGEVWKSTRSYRIHKKNIHLAGAVNNSDEYPYLCYVCGRTYAHLAGLLTHLEKHEFAGKQYECDLCKITFTTQAAFKNHKRSHKGPPRKFTCRLCFKEFSNLNNVKRHENFVHTTLRKEKCNFCEKTFKCKASKNLHQDYVHLKKPYKKRIRRKKIKVEDTSN